ncbi:MAG: metallophosphoesterase family protein [Candidatus Eisenbacteria sp.]|nr:metallophosphoesterase family protein [Candidatus Eisenbacteria bacterium]
MRYAILSDIHGNYEAFTAVLEVIDGMDVDSIVSLGDVVGYGANPNEVVDLARARAYVSIRGNHDQAAIDPGEEVYFNSWAVQAIRWTRDELTAGNLDYLRSLAYESFLPDVRLVHASPSEPEKWRYILSPQAAAREFANFKESFCFIGHSHVPMIVLRTEVGTSELLEGEVALPAAARVLMNVGSVGQPRNGDPRACFAVLDLEDRSARLVHVPYDIHTARAKIVDAGLPRFLGDRLLLGQ